MNVGIINISYTVICPNCDESMYSDLDRDWWDQTFGDGFPVESSDLKTKHRVKCNECGIEFEINHFEH